jgi:release factor glutamine methyltransferase
MTAVEILGQAVERLKDVDGADPRLEARVLLRRAAGFTDMEIFAFPDRPVSKSAARRFFQAVEKRRARIPLAYILREKEFWSIPMAVSPAVLIPRPETELLVEKALARMKGSEPLIIEIGTGSGCVAVALAKEIPDAHLVVTDISRRALRVAAANAARHGAGNIRFVAGSFFGALRGLGLEGRADLIVSNPPYVSEKEWDELAPEIRNCEPRRALVSGPTGLEAIRRLALDGPRFLKPGGTLLLEFGAGQAAAVRRLFVSPWARRETFRDLSGRPRVLAARL